MSQSKEAIYVLDLYQQPRLDMTQALAAEKPRPGRIHNTTKMASPLYQQTQAEYIPKVIE
jgi:hypothetical protein